MGHLFQDDDPPVFPRTDKLVVLATEACFFKRGQDGFASIDRDISDFPVIVLTDILETAENTASA